LKKAFPYAALILLLLIAVLVKKGCHFGSNNNTGDVTKNETRFDRHPVELFFSKHARCRMRCRQVTQEEVREILDNGNINYSKSDLQASEGPKYALEGYSHEHQHIRAIFAPHQQHMTVVTVIDLDNDWPCPSCD
jgi:hypothetical protein